LSNWSGDAGPFCIAVEEAALCCLPLGGLPQGRLTACGLRIKATPGTTTCDWFPCQLQGLAAPALAGVDLVAELPVVVADPHGGGCSVARRRPVLHLRAITPAARMSAALVGAPAAVVVSPDRIDRTLFGLVLRHHEKMWCGCVGPGRRVKIWSRAC
jgi:hypothetical protein